MEIPQIKIHKIKIKIDLLILSTIILAFVVSTTVTLKNYGLSWDEGLGNLFFGERYFYYFLNHQEKYVDFKADLFKETKEFNLFSSPFKNIPYEFPPLADTISAGFMYTLSDKLNIMDSIDAFHFAKIFLSGIFFIIFYFFIKKELNWQIAIISTFLLSFYPRYWGDVHFNPKDIPLLIFFSLTIFVYMRWLKKKSWKNAILVGLAGGATIAIKANAVFLPFVLIFGLWDINIKIKPIKEKLLVWGRELMQHILMGIVMLIFYIGSWPYLYVHNNPFRGIQKYFEFIINQGGRRGPMKFQLAPSIQVITSMPEVMAILLLVGIIIAFKFSFKKPNSIYRLLLVWLFFPIFRISMPGMVNFDGIRHFLEFLPAACILSGIGLWQIWIWTKKFIPKYSEIIYGSVCLLLIFNLSYTLISSNPYQYIYYNQFIGGISGAREKFGENEVTDYWGISYRKGIEWLNIHADPNAKVIVPVAGWLVELSGQIWFRDDIEYLTVDTIDALEGLDEPIYLMILYRPGFFDQVAVFALNHYEVVFQENHSNVRLMTIYKK